jgi:hypothetical protein
VALVAAGWAVTNWLTATANEKTAVKSNTLHGADATTGIAPLAAISGIELPRIPRWTYTCCKQHAGFIGYVFAISDR